MTEAMNNLIKRIKRIGYGFTGSSRFGGVKRCYSVGLQA
ncbi:hypothetical protein [Arcanobacterium phocae]